MTMATDTSIIKLGINASSKEKFDEFCRNNHMSQLAVGTSIFNWFLEQPEEVQKTIIGVVPKSMVADAMVLMLLRMARSGSVGTNMSAEEIEKYEVELGEALDKYRRATIAHELSKPPLPRRRAANEG